MANLFERTTAHMDRALIWVAAFGFAWAGLSWLGKQLSGFGNLGWPEAIFLGLVATSLISLAVAGMLAAWRYFRPLSPEKSDQGFGDPVAGDSLSATGTTMDVAVSEQMERSVYVGQIVLDGEKLNVSHAVEIAVISFNGTNRTLSVSHLRGAIDLFVTAPDGTREPMRLSPPSVLSDRTHLDSIPDHSEFMIVLEQALKPEQVACIIEGIERGPVTFDFDNLNITLRDLGEGATARLPLWGGASLVKDGRLRTAKLHKLQVNSAIGGLPST